MGSRHPPILPSLYRGLSVHYNLITISMTIQDSVDEYISYCRLRLSKSTASSYEYNLRDFISYSGGVETLDDIKLMDVVAYGNMLKDSNLSEATVFAKIAAIRGLIRFHSKMGHKVGVNYGLIPLPKYVNKTGVPATKEMIASLIDQKIGNSYIDILRNVTIMSLLAMSGIRVSELVGLTIRELNLKEMQANIISAKSKKPRWIYWTEEVNELIESYIEEAGPYRKCGSLFVNHVSGQKMTPRMVQRVFKRARLQAGIKEHITPHSMRHYFVTQGADSGVHMFHLQKFAGHASVTTTSRYTHFANTAQKAVYRKHYGKNSVVKKRFVEALMNLRGKGRALV